MPLVPSREYCTAFIYGSAKDGAADRNFVGMGFFVSVASQKLKGSVYVYLVTNAHIVRDLNPVFARIHRFDPKVEASPRFREPHGLATLEIPKKRFVIDAKNDLAVVGVSLPENSLVHHASISHLIPDFRERINGMRQDCFVGVGDEVLMNSRIVRRKVHYLKENIQVARFGNVALIPKHEEHRFFVEMRSIPGHSGSPVWVVLPGREIESGSWNVCGTKTRSKSFGMMLLGINSGHLRDYEHLVTFEASGKMRTHGRWISQTNMAMSEVVPAWHIHELLNSKKLRKERQDGDERFKDAGAQADISKDSFKPLFSRKSKRKAAGAK
jgi:hypothetical protein